MFMDKKTQHCKDSLLLNLIYKFNVIPVRIPASYFVHISKLILKFIRRGERPRTINMILKKNRVEGLTLLDFETYYKTAMIMIV